MKSFCVVLKVRAQERIATIGWALKSQNLLVNSVAALRSKCLAECRDPELTKY